MRRDRKTPMFRNLVLALAAFAVLFASGCQKKETVGAAPVVEEPKVITVRFTDPVEIEPQPSAKCIACHTKTNPINKLARPVSAAAETGG
jgi:hypothetical protein